MLERRTPASDYGPGRHDSADVTGPDRAQGLERRYRRLLRANPASYREHRSDELIAVLMSACTDLRAATTISGTDGDATKAVTEAWRTVEVL